YAALLGEVFNSRSSIAVRRERSCAPRCFLSSAMVLNLALVSVVGGLLHIARAFLQLALDLLAHAFDLLTRASRRFAHFALYPACNVLRHSFNLIAVHENPPKRARIARSGYQTSARNQKKRVQTRFLCKQNTEIAS